MSIASIKPDFTNQLREIKSTLLVIYSTVAIVFIVIFIIDFFTDIRAKDFTGDPLSTLGQPFYTGIISNIGVLLWCSSASICFFGFFVFRDSDNRGKYTSFLLISGTLTSILLSDDLLQLHEVVIPRYLYVPEIVVYIIYGLSFSLYLIMFFSFIVQTEYIIMFLSFLFFGLSVVFDKLPESMVVGTYLIEDGFKVFGIVSWHIYFFRLCTKHAKSVIQNDSYQYQQNTPS